MPKKKRYQMNVDENGFEIERPSRSQKKRESTNLQDLGEQLISFSLKTINKMGLSADLNEALHLLSRISDHEGRRRQKQFIGKLMRYEDIDALQVILEKHASKNTQENANFHRIEKLRENMLNANDEELDELLDAFPHKKNELQALVEKARQEIKKQSASTANIPPTAQRVLFRALRDLLE